MIFAALLIGAMLSSDPAEQIDFDSQVLPVLTKVGCNAGACHGAAAGRGGFRLSLFGSDPQADYSSLVEYAEGRRVNVVDIDKSLVLRKPLGMLDHGGDIVLQEGTPELELLKRWLREGANRGAMHRLVELRVEPSHATLHSPRDTVQLRAIARFSDGNETDVTQWTRFRSEDTTSVEVLSEPMRAQGIRPGKHLIMARFWNRIVPVSLSLPFPDAALAKPSGTEDAVLPAVNFIDRAIDSQLAQLHLTPLGSVDQAAFARRVYLDLVGRLPTPDELLAATSSDLLESRLGLQAGREAFVQRLLDSDEFATYWGLRLARWFKMRGTPNEPQATQAYSGWILRAMKERRPYDEIVRELLTATGDSHEVGAANFARTPADARQHAELISSVWMGTRIQCANCHNHPFAQWTQEDYHGMAAIFARFDRSRFVSLKQQGAVTNIRTGESAIPRIPGVRDFNAGEPALEKFADWLLDKHNPTLAKATVNRLWDGLMGRGLVAGVDDFRETNPPSHAQLLEELATDFSSNGYDIRRTIRLIASSNAYSRLSASSAGYPALEPWYGIALRRPLLPEVHLDAIRDVLDISDSAMGTREPRAISAFDPSLVSPDLDALGRCANPQDCQMQSSSQGLAPKMHAINGELLNRRISNREGRLQSYLKAGMSHRAIIEDFYARALSRRPKDQQLQEWLRQLEALTPEEQVRWLEDWVWAIVSSQDFSTNR